MNVLAQEHRLELVLYGRPDCCLCDRMASLIASALESVQKESAVALVKRNIDHHPVWRKLYRNRIPVLTCNGRVILQGRPAPATVASTLGRLTRSRDHR